MRRVQYTFPPLSTLFTITLSTSAPRRVMAPAINGNDVYILGQGTMPRVNVATGVEVGAYARSGFVDTFAGCVTADVANDRLIAVDETGVRALFTISTLTWGAVQAAPIGTSSGNMYGIYSPSYARIYANAFPDPNTRGAIYATDGTGVVVAGTALNMFGRPALWSNRFLQCGSAAHTACAVFDATPGSFAQLGVVNGLINNPFPTIAWTTVVVTAGGVAYFPDGDGSLRYFTVSSLSGVGNTAIAPYQPCSGVVRANGDIVYAATNGLLLRYNPGRDTWDQLNSNADIITPDTINSVHLMEVNGRLCRLWKNQFIVYGG